MPLQRNVLARFVLLYAALYGSFGIASPFLPAFLSSRGVGPEQLGLLLGAGTAVRLVSAPLAGRIADVFGVFRGEIAFFAILAAMASLLYLPFHAWWALALANLVQAAMLAPLAPLSDALALSWSRPAANSGGGAFEYGWVRGAGSAAFIAGVLLGGQIAGRLGLSAILWFTAGCLAAAAVSARFTPDLASRMTPGRDKPKVLGRDWLSLLRQPAFLRVMLAAALVLGSHAMHDSFAMIRWRAADISSATASVLWSESVAAEVFVFILLGPWLLRVLGRTGALALAAGAGVVRWGAMAQSAEVAVLAAIQPLHGLTFALFHLACMRIIADTVRVELAGTAQAFYGIAGIGGGTALLTVFSGWLFGHFGPAGFWAMALLCSAALPVIWSLQRALSLQQPPSSSTYSV
jgi:PPP family 3-phenylpropionic acid transporter